ncbi:MAG: AzlC family ABC transporter permease, partial [Halanaerobiales bacterium]
MAEKKELRAGFKDALPIIMGYVPIGIAYGMLAVQNGLDGYTTVAMSFFVFAGSSQLITVEMVGKGAAVLAIILMTFLVNLRHLLMSASLSLHFQKTDSRLLPLLSFFITDESFAVGST